MSDMTPLRGYPRLAQLSGPESFMIEKGGRSVRSAISVTNTNESEESSVGAEGFPSCQPPVVLCTLCDSTIKDRYQTRSSLSILVFRFHSTHPGHNYETVQIMLHHCPPLTLHKCFLATRPWIKRPTTGRAREVLSEEGVRSRTFADIRAIAPASSFPDLRRGFCTRPVVLEGVGDCVQEFP